jgi:hypothetical protein
MQSAAKLPLPYAKKRNCGNREDFARHCTGSYHFFIAVWRAKEAESGDGKD